jgi:hypothetical protein
MGWGIPFCMLIIQVLGNYRSKTTYDISANIGVCTFIDGKSGSSVWIENKEYS